MANGRLDSVVETSKGSNGVRGAELVQSTDGTGAEPESQGGGSYTSYRTAMSSLSDMRHPLSILTIEEPVELDPFRSSSSSSSGDLMTSSASEGSNTADFVDPLRSKEALIPGSPRKDMGTSILTPSPRSRARASQYISITVSDPQKEQETSTSSMIPGGGTFTMYLITTKTNIRELGGSYFCVRRRFRDVVALSERLSESFKGFIIPPRPDKNVIERQVMHEHEFIEQRRKELERYLQKLSVHPVIRWSTEFRTFVQVQGNLPFPCRPVTSKLLPGSSNGAGMLHFLKIFSELKEPIFSNEEEDDSEDRELFLEKEKLMDFNQSVSSVSKQAEPLIKAQANMAETMGELGMAFIKLTKFENENIQLESQKEHASQLKEIGTASLRSSRMYHALNSQTVKHLETLHEYMRLTPAVEDAFSHRLNAMETLQAASTKLSLLHREVEKLEQGNTSKPFKLEELREGIKTAETSRNSAFQEYERIRENNKNELKRLSSQKRTDFFIMFSGIVVSQVRFNEKIAGIWEKITEQTRESRSA